MEEFEANRTYHLAQQEMVNRYFTARVRSFGSSGKSR